MNPEILVLDEPTAGLDPRGRREIIGLLLNLPQTLIVATHDLDLVEKLLNRVLIISSGQIVVDGEAKTILKNKDLLEKHGLF
jgi:cobalt/nickel transport system ATP-binding protein